MRSSQPVWGAPLRRRSTPRSSAAARSAAAIGPPGAWGGLPGGGWGPPPGRSRGSARAAGPEQPSPFAERRQRGLFSSFVQTFKLVAMQPGAFFRRVRVDQPGARCCSGSSPTRSARSSRGYSLATGSRVAEVLESVAENMPEEQARYVRMYVESLSGASTVAQIVLAPLAAVIAMYVFAAIVHGILLLFRGAPRGFDATLTAVGYAFGLNLLLVVPGCGGFLALVWAAVAMIVGLGETQRCGTGKSTLAVLSPAPARRDLLVLRRWGSASAACSRAGARTAR